MKVVAYFALATAILTGAARADDEYLWSHGVGRKDTKVIYYGEPESGVQWIIASCNNNGNVLLSLSIDKDTERDIQRINDIRIFTVSVGIEFFPLTGKISEDELNDGYLFESLETLDGRLLTQLSSDTGSNFRFGSVSVALSVESSRHFRRMIKACAGKAGLEDERAQSLVRTWSDQHAKCKGSWHLAGTRKACNAREKTSVLLRKIGWCYGRITDIAQDQANWHRCERDSIHN